MDLILKHKLLKSKPDTVQYVRKQYNFGKPGQIEEAVNIIHEWVQKQKHFKKKDFSLLYYENFIISSKGSIERAKKYIDTMCTTRTLLPTFFENCNVKTDLGKFHDFVKIVMLPKLTEDHYRVDLVKITTTVTKPFYYTDFYKYNIVYAEYLKIHDYTDGYVFVLDILETNLKNGLANLNLVEFRQAMSIFISGYGFRIKGIHLISTSKLVEVVATIIKQVVSTKVGERIFVHKSIEGVYEHIPRSMLPKDYGGDERTLDELRSDWIDALSSEEHLKYMREMNAAGTDENCRQKDEFNDQYTGMPGTFRVLSVD